MRIQYFSDIHLEFFKNINHIKILLLKINKCANTCVIPGDIGYPFDPNYKYFLENISKIFTNIIIIHGNHEYYQLGEYQKNKTIKEIKEKTIDICSKIPNIYFLDNSYIDLPNTETGQNVRFIGSTLWSNIYLPSFMVNDKSNIDEFTMENNNSWYKENKKFIEETVNKSKDIDCVLVTHHLPSFSLINEKFLTGPYQYYNQCFASNCENLIKPPIKAWIFGHTHIKTNKKINDVQCVCNPIGYPGENEESEINYNEIIEI